MDTMLEKLLMSLKVTVLGMGIVFIALIALIYVIELLNKVLNASQQKSNKDIKLDEKDNNQLDSASVELSETTANEGIQAETDEEELIAVITAAIAASLNRSTHDIVVRSVKRIPYNSPVWNIAGRNQQIVERL